MKHLTITLLTLLILSGCSEEQDAGSFEEVVEETTYLMCGDPLNLKKYGRGTIFLIEIKKTEAFRDGVPYEGYCCDPYQYTRTGTYFSAHRFKKYTFDDGRISMDSSVAGGERQDADDTIEYEIRDIQYKTVYGVERKKKEVYTLNRETLEFEFSSSSSSLNYRGNCEISSKEANQDFKNNFLAEKKLTKEKAKERREKEKAEQLQKNKI